MARRKPKPTALKTLEGNPGKRKMNKKEPMPSKGIPACPEWLLPEAKIEWERLAAVMDQGLWQVIRRLRNLRMRWRHCLEVILNGSGNETKGLSKA